jgi:SAM-dependent methyltransferase
VPEVLFDLSAEYVEMLKRGIRLSGESQEFFILGRLRSLVAHLPVDFHVRRILDFGCGIGTTMPHLASVFRGAELVGVDTSESALEYAAEHHGSSRVRFRSLDDLDDEDDFDLCYVNGVFHHIPVENRLDALARIQRALRPGGRLALFENNPWNPGARMVMKRIPFDRDAVMLSQSEGVRLVRDAGFSQRAVRWSLFYFPRALAFLRFSEGALAHLPLGAQYCVLAAKPAGPC